MNSKNPFKWRYFEKEIILLNVRWYLRYALSYRDLEEMMLERGGGKGNTIDSILRAKRDTKAGKRFFRKALKSSHTSTPRVITVDKNPAYPTAIKELKEEGFLPKACKVRQIKYLNNIVKQKFG